MILSKSKNSARVIFLLSLIVLLVGTFFAGSQFERYRQGLPPLSISNNDTPEDVDFSSFWQAWRIIDDKAYSTADKKKLVEGAISGLATGVGDAYTTYFAPDFDDVFRADLEGSFGGIGAELTIKDGALTIVAPLDQSPAQKAGLKAQDIIVKIDGAEAGKLGFYEAISKIRGEKGSSVTLTIARSGSQEPLEIAVVRDTIVTPNLVVKSIGPDNSVGYIKVNQFQEDTASAVKKELATFQEQNKRSLVLDLRDNPGGYLNAAVDLIGLFIDQNPQSDLKHLQDRVAVIEKRRDDKETTFKSTTAPLWADKPMVILVNEASASASEIVAGALRDYGRARLVGVKTFGKGSVQELQDLDNDGTIKITVAKWLTPKGIAIDGTGLMPDKESKLSEGQLPGSDDSQVQAALELVK